MSIAEAQLGIHRSELSTESSLVVTSSLTTEAFTKKDMGMHKDRDRENGDRGSEFDVGYYGFSAAPNI